MSDMTEGQLSEAWQPALAATYGKPGVALGLLHPHDPLTPAPVAMAPGRLSAGVVPERPFLERLLGQVADVCELRGVPPVGTLTGYTVQVANPDGTTEQWPGWRLQLGEQP
jgi:hypothetical protein